MLFLFQVLDSTKVVDKAFNLDPTNVFQFLVGGLVIIIFALCAVVVFMWKRDQAREKRLEELTVSITSVAVNTTNVLERLVQSVDELPAAVDAHKKDIKEAIRTSEAAILRTIDAIKK